MQRGWAKGLKFSCCLPVWCNQQQPSLPVQRACGRADDTGPRSLLYSFDFFTDKCKLQSLETGYPGVAPWNNGKHISTPPPAMYVLGIATNEKGLLHAPGHLL